MQGAQVISANAFEFLTFVNQPIRGRFAVEDAHDEVFFVPQPRLLIDAKAHIQIVQVLAGMELNLGAVGRSVQAEQCEHQACAVKQ